MVQTWRSHAEAERPGRDANLIISLTSDNHSTNKYPAKSHARRVAEALDVSKGLIVLQATPAATYPNSDQPVPFRQDRYFYYLTGCNEPGCYATYDIHADRLVLWLPPIDKRRVVWSGRGSTVEEALEKYDIDEAFYIFRPDDRDLDKSGTQSDALQQYILNYRLRETGGFKTNPRTEPKLSRVYFSSESLSVYTVQSCRLDESYDTWETLLSAVDSCRVIKDEHEHDLIRHANKITAAAHKKVLSGLHRFKSEADVEAAYMSVCISNRAREQAYSPIAGSGPNAAELHYVKNEEAFGDRQMLVLDAGCEWQCYASDVTRTMPLNQQSPGHWPSKECEQIYKLVEKVQEACIKQMKPGNKFTDIVKLADDIAIDGLLELGILKGKKQNIVDARTIRGFYPHGLGHHLGLEVHDVSPPVRVSTADDHSTSILPASYDFASAPLHTGLGSTASSRSSQEDPSILKPGMVITIEPGIYFNAFLLDNFFLDDRIQHRFIDKDVLMGYMSVGGVRIEDDLLITKEGHENLTTALKGESMLECIRGGGTTVS